MTRPLYAPITSSLLVRKGEAKPWQMPGADVVDDHPPPRTLAVAVDHIAHPKHEEHTHDLRLEPYRPAANGHSNDHAPAANGHAPQVNSARPQTNGHAALANGHAPQANGRASTANGRAAHAGVHASRDEWHPPHAETEGAPRRCSIKLSHLEYERLGIIAVKKETTRQHILRQAIENYLAAAQKEYKSACTCLGGNCGSC